MLHSFFGKRIHYFLFSGVVDNLTSDDEDTPLSQKMHKSKKVSKKAVSPVTYSDSEEYIPSDEEYTPGAFS